MVVRLLLVLIVAVAIGAATASDSADAVSVVEHEGESAADLDEVQVVVGEVVLAADDRAIPRAVPESSAPSPPNMQGVFRPPRAAFV